MYSFKDDISVLFERKAYQMGHVLWQALKDCMKNSRESLNNLLCYKACRVIRWQFHSATVY